MKLYIRPYQLKFKNQTLQKSNPEGALLAFDFGGQLRGYSDFLPQTAFGEAPLREQLQNLKKGEESLRFQIAREMAQTDALARKEKRNLFFGLKIPESHFLIENLLSFSEEEKIQDRGYKYVKVKLRPSLLPKQKDKLKQLAKALPHIRWRLDLNGMSWKLCRMDFLMNQLDFIEDPLEQNELSIKEQKLMAEDWIPASRFKIKIAKASRDSLQNLIKGLAGGRWKRVIFTHSFNHPLGQVISSYQAAKFYQSQTSLFETGALKCFSLQEEDFQFHKNHGPAFDPPSGYGFGFDEVLKKQKWEPWL